MDKLGVIAGGGDLPGALAKACRAAGRPYMVLRLQGMTDPSLAAEPGEEIGIAKVGRMLEALRRADCRSVCFAGRVQRPDFSALAPDLTGIRLLPSIIKAAGQGDDALLRAILAVFEREGFRIEGADEVSAGLTLGPGALGRHTPQAQDLADIALGVAAAQAIGRFDIGQGVVVADGLVLAVEAQEGTAAMLARISGLDATIRGTPQAPRGVLVKLPKPIQDRRVDLPAIGAATVAAVRAAGLRGVAGGAGGLLVIDRAAVAAAADAAGLFVYGLEGPTEAG